MLFFVTVASVMLVMIYVVNMPTTRRMDFILLATTIGTAFIVALTAIFKGLYRLLRLAQWSWVIMGVIGAIAILTIVGYSLWRVPTPFISQQWYALFILLGMIGLPGVILLGQAYMEIAEEQQSEFASDIRVEDDGADSGFTATSNRSSTTGGINLHINPEKS